MLRPDDELVGDAYVTISLCLTDTLWLVAPALIAVTRGRLGLAREERVAAPTSAGARSRDAAVVRS